VLTSQKDTWASLNNSQTFYEYLGENGYITIKTDFSHRQEAGQAAHEIYYFGHFINSGKSSSYAPITFKETATGKNTVETSMGRQYTLELTVPAYLDLNHGWSVALNYVTAPLTYVSNPAGTGGSVPSETWTVVTFTPYENGGKWYVDVEIPADAYLYQISFRGYNAALASHSPVGGNNIFQGYMWNSTDVVVLGGGSILAE
ncbi:MAG: hypothetical protein MJ078_07005, partial [Clostridia bacterium]|nr:hypothetical protein [Clostridia bacterium]